MAEQALQVKRDKDIREHTMLNTTANNNNNNNNNNNADRTGEGTEGEDTL